MAAYASLVSLMHIIDNLQLHSRPPITLHKEQAYLLTEKATFLLEFLQVYNPNLPYSKEADPLESRIARAAYAAEDAIESHILDQFTDDDGEKMSSGSLYGALEKVIEDMASVEKEAMEIKDTVGFQNKLHAKSTPPDPSKSTSSSSIAQKESSMVGADDLLLEMKSKLTSDSLNLQTIPIVGMGGSGKTTLALNMYRDRLIEEHFDIRAWVTISQEYNILEILKRLLTQLNQDSSVGELGEMLHKHLYGRKYMIILDDMWSVEAWDGVKRFLPNDKNGSRIVITTRLTTLASSLPNSNSLGMTLLNDDDSWDLLSKIVFGEKRCCPFGFEKIGKKIGKNCRGLPLSIIVVGGLLAKSEQMIELWENMEENLNAIVNLDDDERCLKTLYMSYKQLPVHLKPCFLYMGIYREDYVICISKLVKLWVAEGFLKPASGKRQEDVARAYIKDLAERNLILIHKLGSIGSIKECKVHDLLRDLCLREAQKEGFYTVLPGQEIGNEVSRIVMSGSLLETEEIDPVSSAPLTRSLILNTCGQGFPPHISRQQLRIVTSKIASEEFTENVSQLVNSRFFTSSFIHTKFPSSTWLFWNLHTLIVTQLELTILPTDIWYMSHIRHLYFNYTYLRDPPLNVQANGIVLANLQTLGWVSDFTCSEHVIEKIPNIRKLLISYEEEGVDERFCLSNLDCLDKLESLSCNFKQLKILINYPQSLKKLSLQVHRSQPWQDIVDDIGALPLLQKLNLTYGTFKGQWETTQDRFRSLKFLSLYRCKNLQVWTSEASHFPRLEHLRLFRLSDLEEIPSDFADISTLKVIDVDNCSDSAVESAMRILEEQEAIYGEEETTLQIQVKLGMGNNNLALVESFKSPNFHVSRYNIPGQEIFSFDFDVDNAFQLLRSCMEKAVT